MAKNNSSQNNSSFSLLTGMALGGGLMYLLDAGRGHRRRALLRDKGIHGAHLLRCAADKGVRDLQHRARGSVAELWSALRPDECSDEQLVQRVRARLGRACSHPNSIEVHAEQGRITLSGPVLQKEADLLIDEIQRVRGVHSIEDRLQRHKNAGDIPGLQGGPAHRRGQRMDLFQSRWAPATRLLAGAGGVFLAGDGLRRRGMSGFPEALVGAGLVTRAATNLAWRRLFGWGETRSAIRLQKTINIHAPVEEVFHLCENPENFPRFMDRVRKVHRTGDDCFHWTIAGPAGVFSISFDSAVTERVPNRLVAWKTLPGAAIANAGIMRFDANPDGSTRVHILMSYNPLGGALGHVLASIFATDPKAVLDEDMARLKSLLELGKTHAHGERVTREQLA